MELKCAVVFTLASLVSVIATPHGYGVKGGAAASAGAGAYAGVGLPLSIPSGPGFSGSYSKSSSSSFAASSASSSSSSFSFSGSGAAGFGLNNLGTAGNGCSGGCQTDSKGIKDSHGSGSTGDGLQTFNGVNSNAASAAGAFAGSHIDSKGNTQGPCVNGVCSGHKSQCEGTNCKDENTSIDRDHKECTSGHCGKDSESGPVDELPNCGNGNCNNKKPIPTHPNSENKANCASGQCGPTVPTSTTSNFEPNTKCFSGKCAGGSSTTIPEANYGSNDIPVSIISTSTTSQDSNNLSNSGKTSSTISQAPGVNCNDGNCNLLSPNSKPDYGYSDSSTRPESQPQTAGYGNNIVPSKPATHLTAPKEEEPCAYPNCKSPSTQNESKPPSNQASGKPNCVGKDCSSQQPAQNPLTNILFSQPQSPHDPSGLPTSLCSSPNCNSNKDEPKPVKPSYAQTSPDQNYNVYPTSNCASGNCRNPANSQPKIPDHTAQAHTLSAIDNCASGNCGNQPSYQADYDIQVSKVPYHSSNCASGNCDRSPNQATGASKPTIPSYSNKPTSYENCASGNCDKPTFSIPTQPTIPQYNLGHSISAPGTNCAFGNCGNHPFYPAQSQGSNYSPNCASGICPYNPTSSNFPSPSQQPFPGSSSNCAFGNCGNSPSNQPTGFISTKPIVPSYSQGPSFTGPSCPSGSCSSYPSKPIEEDSSYPRLPSYPQNILPNKPLNCVSGNCANYPAHPVTSSVGAQFPVQPSVSAPTACGASGTCGSYPTYQHGSYGVQSPSYTGNEPALPATICTSGNCPTHPSTQPSGEASKPNIPTSIIGYNPSPTRPGSATPFGSRPDNCASGNCPNYPSNQPSFPQPQLTSSSAPDKFPDYVALGVAGGTANTPLFVPSTVPSSSPTGTASHTTSNSVAAGGAHTQSSILNSHKPNNDKEQIYTGGFGGPPGILKPYEFSAPTPNHVSSYQPGVENSNNKHDLPSGVHTTGSCTSGNCGPQSGINSNNKHDVPSGLHTTGSCSSGNCGPQSGKPHHVQSSTASGAFAAAAASDDGVLYTGGFGGPPGILKPYDGGKIGNIALTAVAKHPGDTALGNNNDAHASGSKLNSGYGAFSGAAVTGNAGVIGSGSYGGGHNKNGGCNSGCGSSEHSSYGGNFGIAGDLSKSGLLEKLHNGVNAAGAAAQSVAGAISGAGTNSFALGGSFASSSASAHAASGSATKGGYGR